MKLGRKPLRALAFASAAAATIRCTDGTAPHPLENSIGAIVSGLVAPHPGAAAAQHSPSVAVTGFAYVSLPPSSVPAGMAATVTNHATGIVVNTAMQNGGFDPVAIGANVGDTLAVDITTNSRETADHALLVVAARRRPRIVRTNPPSGGRDVPLNATVVVVFSEPIDSASLISGVGLRVGDTVPVLGGVDFGDAEHVSVTFKPADRLAPLTSYQIVVTQAIRDLNGMTLDSAAVVTFTTRAAVAPIVTSFSPGNVFAGGPAFTLTVHGSGFVSGSVVNFGGTDEATTFVDSSDLTAAIPASAILAGGPVSVSVANPPSDGGKSNSLNFLVLVQGLVFASVSAAHGGSHTCGVTTNAVAYCWGDSQGGVLGNGTWGSYETPALEPAGVAGGLSFATVSAGWEHTCGLTTTGAVYCWGDAAFLSGSQVSICPTGCLSPTPLGGGLTFARISAGEVHTCGVTTTGAGYCWGDNSWGQLGDGTENSSSVPVAVAGGLTFASVSAGAQTTCGVTTAGAAYCWGQNLIGELGIGTIVGPEQCPGDLPTDPTISCSHVPVAVGGGRTFRSVSVGGRGVCGLTTAGAAYCWGSNVGGGLGTGSTQGPEACTLNGASFSSPCSTSPSPVAGGLTFTALDVGCGVASTGRVYCWGGNSTGALGDGTTTDRLVPVPVVGTQTFATVSTNGGHTCAVTTGGVAYCWGGSALGTGYNGGSLVPVKVALQP